MLYPVELRAHSRRLSCLSQNPGRGRGIRTPDPLLPKQMRYQAAPCPDFRYSATRCPGRGQTSRGHDNTGGPDSGQSMNLSRWRAALLQRAPTIWYIRVWPRQKPLLQPLEVTMKKTFYHPDFRDSVASCCHGRRRGPGTSVYQDGDDRGQSSSSNSMVKPGTDSRSDTFLEARRQSGYYDGLDFSPRQTRVHGPGWRLYTWLQAQGG